MRLHEERTRYFLIIQDGEIKLWRMRWASFKNLHMLTSVTAFTSVKKKNEILQKNKSRTLERIFIGFALLMWPK